LELEHFISREAPRSAILSIALGTDISSLHAFLETLSGNGLEYDSNNINHNAPPCMCYHIDGEDPAEEAPELMPPDQSHRSHVAYI